MTEFNPDLYAGQVGTIKRLLDALGFSIKILLLEEGRRAPNDSTWNELTKLPVWEDLQKDIKTHPWSSIRQWVKRERNHLHSYMQRPPDPRIDPIHHKIGNKIDHLALKICDVVEKADKLYHTPELLAKRKAAIAETERKRQERIERRRQQRSIQTIEAMIAQPPVKPKAKGPHEEHELCFKCGKRRAVENGWCESCLRWAKTALDKRMKRIENGTAE